jgi:PAS domain S-box-containing protein
MSQELREKEKSSPLPAVDGHLFRLMISGVKDYAIFMLNPNGRIVSWNEGARRIKGYAEEEVLGKNFSLFYPEEDRSHKPGRDLDIATRAGRLEDQGWRIRKDGSRFWADVVITALRDEEGSLMGFAKVTRDITDRKLSEESMRRFKSELERRVIERTYQLATSNSHLKQEIAERRRAEERLRGSLAEKETLLKEIHHRVKNNLQLVYSLINLESRHVHDKRTLDGLRDCRERIRAMTLVHEKLYRSPELARVDFGDYLQELAEGLLRSYSVDNREVRLSVGKEKVFLSIDEAIPCSLILYELISNSLKHAFLERRKGAIDISLHKSEDGNFLFVIKDDGVGWPDGLDFRHTTSLGLNLVCALARQLHGKIDLKNDGGTEFSLLFPSAAKAGGGEASQ